MLFMYIITVLWDSYSTHKYSLWPNFGISECTFIRQITIAVSQGPVLCGLGAPLSNVLLWHVAVKLPAIYGLLQMHRQHGGVTRHTVVFMPLYYMLPVSRIRLLALEAILRFPQLTYWPSIPLKSQCIRGQPTLKGKAMRMIIEIHSNYIANCINGSFFVMAMHV